MANKGKSTGGGDGGREVVVTMDRRVLYVLGLFVAFFLAVGAGFLLTTRGDSPQAADGSDVPSGQEQQAGGGTPDPFTMDEASAQGTAKALLGPEATFNIVQNMATHELVVSDSTPEPEEVELLQPDTGSAEGDGDGESEPSGPEAEIVKTMQPAATFVYPTGDAAATSRAERYKTGDVLCHVNDPNVTNTDYAPLRLETVSKPLDGPRLAIAGLNIQNSYCFGEMAMDDKRAQTFTAKNVGIEDLLISRVYTGCGCTATTIGDQIIRPDGILPEPIALAPEESIDFTIEYDAGRENREGATAKYIQVFTNDPTNVRFDDEDPLTHETRFRIVVDPRWFVSSQGTPQP